MSDQFKMKQTYLEFATVCVTIILIINQINLTNINCFKK